MASPGSEEITASVVIGVFNRAGPIVACVRSLVASTSSGFEIILVEDGSTDDSALVLDRLASENPDRIVVVRNRTNRGASGARNVGMERARGEFVLFTDSDCVVEPTWIEEMVAAFRRSGAAGVSGTVLDKQPSNRAERAYVGSCLVIHKAPNLMESNMGLRRDLGLRFDEAIFGGEGDDLAIRMRAAGQTVTLAPAAIVHHHHALTFRSYMRMARQQGHGHTLLWYKHGRLLGRDIAAGGLAVLASPLLLAGAPAACVPITLALLQLGAILFNEAHYKGKSLGEALAVAPEAVAYYAVRIAAFFGTRAGIWLGREPAIVASRRAWRTSFESARGQAPESTPREHVDGTQTGD